MRHSKRRVFLSALTIALMVVLGLSFGSTALAQEARWKALYNQVAPLLQKGKVREAISVSEETLKATERTSGPEHPDTATDLQFLGSLYIMQKDFTKAEPLFKRALAIREKVLGPNHPEVAESLMALVFVYLGKGQLSKAGPLSERALSIREKAFRPDHAKVAESLDFPAGPSTHPQRRYTTI